MDGPDTQRGHGGVRWRLVGFACATAVLAWAVYLAVQTGWAPLAATDQHLLLRAHEVALKEPWLVLGFKVLSRLTAPLSYYVLTAAIAVVLAWRRRPIHGLFLMGVILGGLQLAPLLKGMAQRARPALVDPVAGAGGLSFPSGHAVGVTVVALSAFVALTPLLDGHRRLAAALMVCTLMGSVGASRIFLGVHFFSDVLAGILVGVSWVSACTAATWALLRRERPGSVPARPPHQHPTGAVTPPFPNVGDR
jgi:undecaprenyl-diphosphatase